MLFILILITSLLLQFFLPWWIIAPIAFGLAFWKAVSGKNAFISGFGAVFILWIIMGLIQSLPNENLLANRVGEMLMLPLTSYNWIVVLIATGLIGGLSAGMAALAGFYTSDAFKSSSGLRGA